MMNFNHEKLNFFQCEPLSKLPRIHSGDIKESVGISLISIRKMGPPLEAFPVSDAFGRSGEERPGRFRTRGV